MAFFALLLASILTSVILWLPAGEALQTMKTGFGNILQSLGWIVVLGTTLGIILEAKGYTQVMAASIMRAFGKKRASLSVASTGFIVGLPVFCDAGYIVLNGLNPAIARKTSTSLLTLSISLASGLYVVHCLIPPHPGAAAAATALQVDFGKLTAYGLMVALPAMLLAHAWARRCGKIDTFQKSVPAPAPSTSNAEDSVYSPSPFVAFLPVIIPLLLITTRAILINKPAFAQGNLAEWLVLGDPIVALGTGVLIALLPWKSCSRKQLAGMFEKSIEKAGPIILITGAGGAFGAILSTAGLGEYLAGMEGLDKWGLLVPFGMAFLLKTAQGSSTVAMITSASIIVPILPMLGLDSDNGRILATLSMGAGSMMISHANDSYFWVIARFSGIEFSTMVKTFTIASIILGVSSILMIVLLSFLIN